jgi:diguanylate cyclase (GGDEF)-like protein/putative nucleotidyltransferase with HDIG domain
VEIIPGNTFPFDTLTGVAFALFLMYALYKRRMFRLTLLVSKSVVLLTSCVLCILGSAYFVSPIKDALITSFGLSDSSATCIVVVLFSILIAVVYFLLKKLLDALFTREEQQNRILKDFSNKVSRTLKTDEIMDELIGVITNEIPVCGVFVCLPKNGAYVARYSSNPLAEKKFSISADSPLVAYLKNEDRCFTAEEFRSSPYYLSLWQGEKKIFKELDITCVVGLGDGEEIVGLLLLPGKERGATYTYGELSFLETVSTITSIAVKNACLYERVYYESRTDTLTGVYNYKHFMERIDSDFDACRDDSLALLYLDIDDFKLYNQLYGNDEGDAILRSIAGIITFVAGQNGTVYRVSGKVFAVLLPRYDGRRALLLAEEIRRRVDLINSEPGRRSYKQLTISGGICVYPYAASTPKELMENADMAVFNAKNAGKDTVVIFKGAAPVSHQIVEKTMDILDRAENDENSSYKASSATIHALTAAIDAKDNYTGNHSRNVARYASILATAAGLNDEQVQIVYEAALMHDIGKISIPERILNKTEKLTGDEYDQMKEHVNNAIEMIRHLPSMDYVIPAAIGHHERWDGKGYPRGIAGENIPVSARCLAVADAFDAMTTDRPYRKGLSVEYAADQIEKNAGTQFDPNLAHIFAQLVRSGEIVVNVESRPAGREYRIPVTV